MVGGLYNVFWGKSIEERDDLTKISAAAGGKPGLELPPPPPQNNKAGLQAPLVPDDDDAAEAKV